MARQSNTGASGKRLQKFIPQPDALEVHGSSGAGGAVLMPRPYTLTMPEDDMIYGVKDDQLEALISGGRSNALEWGLFSLGLVVGFVPQAFSTVASIANGGAVEVWSVVGLCVLAGLFVVSLLKLEEHRRNRKRTDTLAAKIRAGQRLRVG